MKPPRSDFLHLLETTNAPTAIQLQTQENRLRSNLAKYGDCGTGRQPPKWE
jgi:hypothetical protein